MKIIGIHAMQGWTAIKRHGVTRKKAQKIEAYTDSL